MTTTMKGGPGALVVQGDALYLPLPDASVDLIVTSPPYWALRSYSAGPGEIGSEPTPQEYLDALWAATAEMMRVLKPTGSLFVDLGDKYNAYNGNRGDGQIQTNDRRPLVEGGRGLDAKGIPAKSLMLLPERYRVGCVDRLDLIAREVIIWRKPNGLPESVRDRCPRTHEDWVHLVKQPRYYSATDEVREPHADSTVARAHLARTISPHDGLRKQGDGRSGQTRETHGAIASESYANNPLGKLPGSVWTIGDNDVWTGPINFCPRCGRDLTAGNGRVGRPERVTVSSGSPESGTGAPTASPTNDGPDPSQPGSHSTTSAAIEDASTLPTLSPSPASRTSPEATPPQSATEPRPTVSTGTSSPPPLPTPGLEVVESARCVCETVSEHDAPGSVWSVPSEPLRLPEHLEVQHYAAFPSEWPRRLILGWSPPGICLDCGQGRVPVVERENTGTWGIGKPNRATGPMDRNGHSQSAQATILGYACSCTPFTDHPERRGTDFHAGTDRPTQGMNDGNGGERFRRYQEQLANPRDPVREYHLDGWKPPPTRPAIVLDPFGGTGTTAMVARALGRIGVGVDLSMPYCRAARWRIHHDAGKAISRTNLERQGSLL